MGVKRGSKRGPYKKRERYDDNGDEIPRDSQPKKKVRSFIPCPGINDDGTRCNNLSYRFGHCHSHQHMLPIWKQVPIFICEVCNIEITNDKKSEAKTLCSKCILTMGQKCTECHRGTLNFDTGLCKRHLPENICSVEGCKTSAHYGQSPTRYCKNHNPDGRCNHEESQLCGRKTGKWNNMCSRHGGKDGRMSNAKTCEAVVQKRCKRRIPFVREVDMHRVPDTTKCFLHGGIPCCYVCEKLTCVGFEGMCEDHGGTTCSKCSGPLYLNSKNSTCHLCNHKSKLERLAKQYHEKKKQEGNTQGTSL